MYKIDSKISIGPEFGTFTENQVKNEPMLFNCDAVYAIMNGGPITTQWLQAIQRDGMPLTDLVIDTRVHMLMPGWFPCIPGFHHDDVPRSPDNGQPDYDAPMYRSKHILGLVNGEICPTEFALGEFNMSKVPDNEIIYKKWHLEVVEQLEAGIGSRVSAPSNRLVYFDDRSFHQGVRAVKGGWRWFARASYQTARQPTNEIRRQVQVYLEFPMEGW